MESYIKREFMMMADSLVAGIDREYCREATALSFPDIQDPWVSHEQFNIYMQALRRRTGEVGPRIVGKQIGKTIDEHFGSLTEAATVDNLLKGWPQVYSDNNTGEDSGFLKIENLTDKSVDVITTSPLDEGFHLGVGEGFIRFYKKMIKRAELITSMETHGETHLRYEWA